MVSDLLIQGVPIECINQAALTYYVPAKIIVAVLQVENGKPGLASRNRNGSFDYGPMQINSIWIPRLSQYGFSKERLQTDACANVMAGAWILSKNLANKNSYWQSIGDYHSHTSVFNRRYKMQVQRRYAHLNEVLANVG